VASEAFPASCTRHDHENLLIASYECGASRARILELQECYQRRARCAVTKLEEPEIKVNPVNSLQEFVGYGAYTESGIVLARRLILQEGSRIEP
jgi:hypothetical protein